MISLDQVHALEKKVESAVSKIVELKNENIALKNRISILEKENAELNSKVSVFEKEQNRVEEGILSVLNRLDVVEDTVSSSAPADFIAPKTESVADDDDVAAEPAEMDIRIHEEEPATDTAADSSEKSDTETVADDSFSPKSGENGQFDMF